MLNDIAQDMDGYGNHKFSARLNIPDKFRWSCEYKTKYEEVFKTDQVKNMLCSLEEMLADEVQSDVQILVDKVCDILVTAGDLSLPRKS